MRSIDRLYFDWLVNIVCGPEDQRIYSDLLNKLYLTEFYWEYELDENCAINGIDLRYIFLDMNRQARNYGNKSVFLEKECSILEMMVSLSMKMEEIMSNDAFGDRTPEWFWKMISSLGLICYDNYSFNEKKVDEILYIFMHHEYNSDGKGSLFYMPGCKSELKNENFWQQASLYLSEVSKKNHEIY